MDRRPGGGTGPGAGGGLTEQFYGRPASAADVALYAHFLKRDGKGDALAVALVRSAEYGALASA